MFNANRHISADATTVSVARQTAKTFLVILESLATPRYAYSSADCVKRNERNGKKNVVDGSIGSPHPPIMKAKAVQKH